MLESITIRNLILIKEEEIGLTAGLNILSGETGAGKSVIIGSILMALGGRAEKDVIRQGETEAYVELIFHVEGQHSLEGLSVLGLETEDGQLIVSRKFTGGRSICRINGEAVPLAKVREAAPFLLDVYGQREHQTLLRPASQLALVDRYGRAETEPLRKKLAAQVVSYRKADGEYRRCQMDEAVRLRNIDILNFEIQELTDAGITPGEEEKLSAAWKKLSGRQKAVQGIRQIIDCISGEGGALDSVGRAAGAAGEIADYGPECRNLYSQLMDVQSILSDCDRDAGALIDSDEDDAEQMERISERLDQIRHLMQKYGCGEKELLDLLARKTGELETLTNMEKLRDQWKKKAEAALREAEQTAALLSAAREKAAAALGEEIERAVQELNFSQVHFAIRMDSSGALKENGCDTAEFLVSMNTGESLRPLADVASGGELSRIMLAVKSVLAGKEETETLIFDEIDAGISGRTAQRVGKKLKKIAGSSQVICISHLPQIVAMADTHFYIEKRTEDGLTATHIRRLNREESIRELARLLGGTEITERVLDNAREMKELAEKSGEDKKDQPAGKP